MGYRWRRMYYATGLPGWMRLGYSPGWIGRSPTGLSPTAEWIMSSDMLPQFREYLRTGIAPPMAPPTGTPLTKEQEAQMLEQQAKFIEAQLEATRKRLEAAKKGSATEEGAQSYSQRMPYGYPTTAYGLQPTPYVTPPPEEELASLEDYKRKLDDEVKGVEARIEELRKPRERGDQTQGR